MAKEYSYDPTGPVKTRDLRVCKFYAKLLKNKFNDSDVSSHRINNLLLPDPLTICFNPVFIIK